MKEKIIVFETKYEKTNIKDSFSTYNAFWGYALSNKHIYIKSQLDIKE
jgi:hypothetical protein